MDKVLNMTYASSLTNLCEVNSSFDTGVLRICYTGENRNKSFLSKEAITKSIPTLYNCPIVCNYDRESDTLGGHDMEIVCDGDGNLRIVNVTTPVGVIPESAKVWFEDYTEDDGTVHEYLYAEVLLWKRQEAYRKIKNDGITAHSMEIKVKSGKSVDGVYHVADFEFNAFALIGVTPCFESSALEMFSKNNFKQQMSEMMQDLKETFTTVNPSKEDDNTHPQNYSMEGGEKVLEDKMNLAAKYGIDVDKLDFSIEDFTVEELTEKFEAMKNDDEKGEPDGKFALTSNMVEEINRVLTAEKVTRDWGECPRYCYVDCDIEAGEVYCWDRNDWLLYGFAFSVDGDSINIDFESKKRKKYVIADFDGGEQASPIAPVFELMENKLKDYAEIETKFNAASDTITSMTAELDELRQFKTDTENATAMVEREEVFAQFEDLVGIEAFETLKDDCMKYDLETLEEKCFAIRGRNGAALKFSAKEKAPKLKVPKTDISNEPYGGLFVKYANTGSN
ncbi:MAG: hypothetical protein Q4F79_00355 [Eubacteriales bacterium]|nr:hypothetical protein [Eubacteriales bacterium]